MHFYDLEEASEAIAEQLYPNAAESRQACAERYRHILYGKLCEGYLIGRNAGDLDPIDHRRPGAVIAFWGCRISESDLNAWLERFGNGVRLAHRVEEPAPVNLGPTSKEIASTFSRYLCAGFDEDGLRRMLNDASENPRLREIRTVVGPGSGTAHWNKPAELALELVRKGKMMASSAWQCIEENYPDQLAKMGKKPEPTLTDAWHSVIAAGRNKK